MRNGSEAFFQVAVALIPAFLFGGAMRRPKEAWTSGPWVRAFVMFVLLVSVMGEIFAIRGVIDPARNRFEQYWVVLTVVGGTVLIAALTASSWLRSGQLAGSENLAGPSASEAADFPKSTASRKAFGKAAVAPACLAVAFIFAFAFAAYAITTSLDHVDDRRKLIRGDQEVRSTTRALRGADNAVTTARTALISAVLAMRARTGTRLAVTVEREINAIDDAVGPVIQHETPRTTRIAQAKSEIAGPAKRLTDPFYKDLGTRRADPEMHLGALMADRLISAERIRLSAKESSAIAKSSHRQACQDATGLAAADLRAFGCPEDE